MDDDIKGRRFFFELARRLAKARRPPKLIGTEAPKTPQKHKGDGGIIRAVSSLRALFRLNPSNRSGLFFTRLSDAFFHQIQNGLLLIRCTPFLEERSHHRSCNVVPQGSDG